MLVWYVGEDECSVLRVILVSLVENWLVCLVLLNYVSESSTISSIYNMSASLETRPNPVWDFAHNSESTIEQGRSFPILLLVYTL